MTRTSTTGSGSPRTPGSPRQVDLEGRLRARQAERASSSSRQGNRRRHSRRWRAKVARDRAVAEEKLAQLRHHHARRISCARTTDVRGDLRRLHAAFAVTRWARRNDLGRERPAWFASTIRSAPASGSISNGEPSSRRAEQTEAMLCGLCERVCSRARSRGVRAATVTLRLRYLGLPHDHGSRTITPASVDVDVHRVVLELYRKARTRPGPCASSGWPSQLSLEEPQLKLATFDHGDRCGEGGRRGARSSVMTPSTWRRRFSGTSAPPAVGPSCRRKASAPLSGARSVASPRPARRTWRRARDQRRPPSTSSRTSSCSCSRPRRHVHRLDRRRPRPAHQHSRAARRATLGLAVIVVGDGFSVKARGGNVATGCETTGAAASRSRSAKAATIHRAPRLRREAEGQLAPSSRPRSRSPSPPIPCRI